MSNSDDDKTPWDQAQDDEKQRHLRNILRRSVGDQLGIHPEFLTVGEPIGEISLKRPEASEERGKCTDPAILNAYGKWYDDTEAWMMMAQVPNIGDKEGWPKLLESVARGSVAVKFPDDLAKQLAPWISDELYPKVTKGKLTKHTKSLEEPMTQPTNFQDLLTQIAKPAVSKIVEIQRDFLEGRGEIKYKLVEDGIAKSPATLGDEESQKIYEGLLNNALGAGNILFKNEEDTGNAASKGNIVSEESARTKYLQDGGPVYRIAIDPIDGTGNYSGDKTPGKERKPVNRSIEELSDEELASKAVRPGWGSMLAIQEMQPDGDWKTVASALYESNSTDTPEQLNGKFYVAQTGQKGVKVINLQTGEPITSIQDRNAFFVEGDAPDPTSRIVEGGFAKLPGQKEGQQAIQALVDSTGDQRIDFSCVAQSALASIIGKADGFFQGHPNLHDVLAIAHLAEASGLYTAIVDKHDGKQAVQTEKDGVVDIKYPVFMSTSAEKVLGMVEQYAAAAGFDKDKLTFRDGNWKASSYKELQAGFEARDEMFYELTPQSPISPADQLARKRGAAVATIRTTFPDTMWKLGGGIIQAPYIECTITDMPSMTYNRSHQRKAIAAFNDLQLPEGSLAIGHGSENLWASDNKPGKTTIKISGADALVIMADAGLNFPGSAKYRSPSKDV